MKIEDCRINQKVQIQGFDTGIIKKLGDLNGRYYVSVELECGTTLSFHPNYLEPAEDCQPSDNDRINAFVAGNLISAEDVVYLYTRQGDLDKTFRFCRRILDMGYSPKSFYDMLTK